MPKTLRASEHAGPGELPEILLRGVRAPAGMPLLFDDDGRFLREVHLFLLDRLVRRRGASSSVHTLWAYADDLSVWWSFLDANEGRWDEIHDATIHDFVAVLTSAVSPITGRTYAPSTILRRVQTVLMFYEWAAGEGCAHVHGNVTRWGPNRFVNADKLTLAHVMRKAPKSRSLVKLKQVDPADRVNILSTEQLRKVLRRLGPDLTPGQFDQSTSIRNRLIAEWALYTGMRLHEVLGLTKAQVLSLALGCEGAHPAKLIKLRLVVTKGGRKRDVLAPAFLLRASQHYIATERSSVLKTARHRNGNYREPAQLFLNSEDTNVAYVGKPLAGKVASRHFSAAVMGCGYIDEIDTSKGVRRTARFRYHDLRHTFAVRTYVELEAAGKPEPWKTIQTLLGHRFLSTTINTYLKHVRIDEVAVGDALGRHIRMIADAA